MVIGSPGVIEGTVYIGSTDRNFYAVDVTSGKEKWKFEVKSRVTSSPAVSAGAVTLALTTAISMRWRR